MNQLKCTHRYMTHKNRIVVKLKILTVPVLVYAHQIIGNINCKIRNQSISVCESPALASSFKIKHHIKKLMKLFHWTVGCKIKIRTFGNGIYLFFL